MITKTLFLCALALVASVPSAFGKVGLWGGMLADQWPIFLSIEEGESPSTYAITFIWVETPGQGFERATLTGTDLGGYIQADRYKVQLEGTSGLFYGQFNQLQMANLVKIDQGDPARPEDIDLRANGWEAGAINPARANEIILERAAERHPRDRVLRAAFERFPLVTPKVDGDGRPAFTTLALDDMAVDLNGLHYGGFRFIADFETGEDLAWAFIGPENRVAWYILPQRGEMKGFTNFHLRNRDLYPGLTHLEPAGYDTLMLQRLSGESLVRGQSYLIWFQMRDGGPAPVSVALTFAPTSEDRREQRTSIERALKLR